MLLARVSAPAVTFSRAFAPTAARLLVGFPWRPLNAQGTEWPCSTPPFWERAVRHMSSVMRPPSQKEMESRILTTRMKEAASATQFLSVLEEALDGEVFNDSHVSVAYHSLATWKRKGELGASDRKNPVLGKLDDRFKGLLAKGDKVSSMTLATVLWSVAHLSNALPDTLDIVPVLVDQIPVMAKDMNSRNLSNSLWEAATLRDAAPGVLNIVPELCRQIYWKRRRMNAQDVSNNFWAAATLKEAAPDVLRMIPGLISQLPLVTESMKPQALSNSLWSAATLKEAAPDVLKTVPALSAQIPLVTRDMSAQEVSNSLWAAATLREAAPTVLKIVPALAAQIPTVSDCMIAQAVSNTLWAVANLQGAEPDVLKMVPVLLARVLVVAKDMNAQSLSNSLLGLVLLKDSVPEVDSFLSPTARSKGNFALEAVEQFKILFPTMNQTDLRLAVPLVTWACARLEIHNDMFLAAVSQHFGSRKKCSSLTDWSVCALHWSFKILDSRNHYKDFQKILKTASHSRGFSWADVQNSQHGPSQFYAAR